MREKVTINFLKYAKGGTVKAFQKCLVLELPSAKVRAIEACVDYPAAVKALVQNLLDEQQCDHAEIAATLRTDDGKTRFIRTYKPNYNSAQDMANPGAARNS